MPSRLSPASGFDGYAEADPAVGDRLQVGLQGCVVVWPGRFVRVDLGRRQNLVQVRSHGGVRPGKQDAANCSWAPDWLAGAGAAARVRTPAEGHLVTPVRAGSNHGVTWWRR